MTPTQVMAVLDELEASFPVDEWRLHGVDAWPVLRIWLAVQLRDREARSSPKGGRTGAVGRLLAQLARGAFAFSRARLQDRQRLADRGDAVFLTESTSRSFAVGGKWYDIHCQPIAELLAERGRESVVWEVASGHEYRVPRASPSRFIQPRLMALDLGNALPVPAIVGCPGFSDVEHLARTRFGLEIAHPLGKCARLIRWLANSFKNSLRHLGARTGWVVNYYDIKGMAFVLACRELEMLSIDIQHGIQGALHWAYGGWNRVPRDGYNVLPAVFWTWSDEETAATYAWSGHCHRALVGGNQILSRFLDDNSELVRVFDAKIAELCRRSDKNVLVTLGLGMPELLREAVRVSPPGWRWWIRLHPSMMAQRASIEATLRPLGERVFIEEALLPLYALLRHVDVHVTESSSVVIEAEQFGVPSVVCHPFGMELYARQMNEGTAAIASSPAAICTEAAKAKRRPRRRAAALDAGGLDAFLRERGA